MENDVTKPIEKSAITRWLACAFLSASIASVLSYLSVFMSAEIDIDINPLAMHPVVLPIHFLMNGIFFVVAWIIAYLIGGRIVKFAPKLIATGILYCLLGFALGYLISLGANAEKSPEAEMRSQSREERKKEMRVFAAMTDLVHFSGMILLPVVFGTIAASGPTKKRKTDE